ncbi:MAG: alpha/beta fold hydrolase [Solirubrobacteraceae bacterium]|nr:alpha/beta fold hydrolase [Solirubrobacteraceae bacterium]
MSRQALHAQPPGLRVLTDGHGPDVLLIAGPGDDASAWEPQIAALAGAFRMTRYDARALDAANALPGAFTQASLVEEALAVLDVAGIERAHVIGTSLGGVIAQMLAIYHPERVVSITLCATWARPDQALRARYDSRPWATEHAGSTNALLEHDTRVLLASVPLPALIVAGADDPLGASHSRQLAALLQHGRLELVAGAGRRPNEEQAATFNRLVEAFLVRASSSAR